MKINKALYTKGYEPNWTTELFRIAEIIKPDLVEIYHRFLVKGLLSNKVSPRMYYEWEIMACPVVENLQEAERETIRRREVFGSKG